MWEAKHLREIGGEGRRQYRNVAARRAEQKDWRGKADAGDDREEGDGREAGGGGEEVGVREGLGRV